MKQIEAGDFAFISFPNVKGMNEPHPFSILNVPSRDGYVQMSIESVGDFTNKLPKLNEGEKATLTRGYAQQGRFSKEQLDSYLPIGKNYNYIIAGPMTMNRSYSKLLQEKGISKNNIYY